MSVWAGECVGGQVSAWESEGVGGRVSGWASAIYETVCDVE